MLSASRLVPLLAGLALGSAATWTLLHLHSPPAASTAALSPRGFSQPAAFPTPPPPPPRLAGPEATTALDAYLALPPLPDKAPAAELVARTTQLRVLLTRLPVSLFERLLSALASRNGTAEARLRLLALDVWTEHDAPAAARWAVALVPGESIDAPTRARYATTAALAWGETTFDPAYAWASVLSDTKLGADLARELLTQLAATDPTRALALARAAGDEFFKASQQALFTAWAAKDPAAAVQALGPGLLEAPTIPKPLFAALGQWFARDSSSAFAWILAQPPRDGDTYNTFLYSAFARLGDDPATARAGASLLLAHPELSDQLGALRILTGSWTRQNPNSALAWLDGIPDAETRTRLIDSVIRVRSTYDLKIEDFLAFALRLPESPDRDKKISAQINGWATTDPDAALAWLAAHDSPGLASVAARVQGTLQGTLLARLAETDPAAALAKWKNRPAGLDQATAAGPLASAWAKTDPTAAAAWLSAQMTSFPSAAQKSDAIRSFAEAWSRTDVASAARWMTDQLATLPAVPDASGIDQTRQGTYYRILTQLAQSDPHATFKLAATATDPSLQRAIYDTLTYDRYFDFRGNIAEPTLSFASRAELVATIPDESNRTPVLTNLLSNWLRQDFESARAWIDSHDAVSPELAAQLITKADPAAP